MLNEDSIEFKVQNMPRKKLIVQLLLFLEFPLIFPLFKKIILRDLDHCENIKFFPGFKYLYGNIHATDVYFHDAFIADYAPVYIGENTRFSFDNMLITSSHKLGDFDRIVAKPIFIGKNVWITSRCIILGGVTIGDNSVIGAGCVVDKDVPSNSLAIGNPMKIRPLNNRIFCSEK